MRVPLRFDFASVAFTIAAIVPACSGKGSGGGPAGGGSCDQVFDAIMSCATVPLPADEVARERPRFDAVCAAAMALPGQGATSSTLDACASALRNGGCVMLDADSGPCAFASGTLAGGSACVSDGQCQSGTCTPSTSATDGGYGPCGTCAAPSAIGQACQSHSCGPSAACMYSNGNSTCVSVTVSGSGHSCDGYAVQCSQGLVCNQATLTCSSPAAAGATCAKDGDCASPLVCPPASSAGTSGSTCQSPGATGARCRNDFECAAGIACDPWAQTCGPRTWAAPGQACGSGVARCYVGVCPNESSGGGGVCPAVVADGQPCDPTSGTTTCDAFAQCVGGRCVLGYDGLCP
jgi:hypothetical protein